MDLHVFHSVEGIIAHKLKITDHHILAVHGKIVTLCLDMIHLLMAQTIEPMVEAHRVRPGEETGTEEAAAEAESAAAVENAENAEETV